MIYEQNQKKMELSNEFSEIIVTFANSIKGIQLFLVFWKLIGSNNNM